MYSTIVLSKVYTNYKKPSLKRVRAFYIADSIGFTPITPSPAKVGQFPLKDGVIMIDKLKNIINALNDIQLESFKLRAIDDKYFWLDYYAEQARINVKQALKELES